MTSESKSILFPSTGRFYQRFGQVCSLWESLYHQTFCNANEMHISCSGKPEVFNSTFMDASTWESRILLF
jgi:hypothetical protein